MGSQAAAATTHMLISVASWCALRGWPPALAAASASSFDGPTRLVHQAQREGLMGSQAAAATTHMLTSVATWCAWPRWLLAAASGDGRWAEVATTHMLTNVVSWCEGLAAHLAAIAAGGRLR